MRLTGFICNNEALIAPPLRPQVRGTRNFIVEDFLINLQNFNEKQLNFSEQRYQSTIYCFY